MCSITEQTHDNMESICKSPRCYFSSLLLPFLFMLLEYSLLEKFFNVIYCSKQIINYGENILQNSASVTIDCSSSTFAAQTDTLFKSLKSEMVTTLAAHTHLGQRS